MSDDGIKKDEINLDEELTSLDDFLNENDDGADSFPLDDNDDDFAFYDEKKKKSGFAKLLGYTAIIALIGGVAFAGYKFIPQLTGTSSLSEFEQNMMNRADNFSDPFGSPSTETAQNDLMAEIPMPDASDTDAAPELDVVIIESNDNTMPDENDLSISNVDVTIIPEGEPLPDDVAAMIGQDNVNGFDDTVQIIDGNDDTPQAATISEALEIVNEAGSVEEVENAVDAEIEDAFNQDFPVENMPSESVDAVEQEVAAGFNRIPSSPMTRGFNEIPVEEVSDVKIDVESVDLLSSETILVTEEPSDPVITIEDEAIMQDDDIPMPDEIVVEDVNTMDDLPNINDNTVDDIAIMDGDNDATPDTMVIVEDVTPQTETILEETVATVEPVVAAPAVKQVPSSPTKVAPKKVMARPAPAVVKQPVIEKYSINNAEQLNTTIDPRVMEGQRALSVGDFDTANRIFTSVLASNPSNIHALTGKQMAVSKIRVPMPNVAPTRPAMPIQAPSGAENMRQRSMPDTTSQIMNAPVQPTSVTSLPSMDTKIVAPANSVQALILQMNTNPRDANGAVQLAQAYAQQGQTAKAVEWYQKALQLDALYQTGVNRMAVYDALAGLQQ